MAGHRPAITPAAAISNALRRARGRLRDMPRKRKLKLALSVLVMSLVVLVLRFFYRVALEMYPEVGAWASNLCRHEDLWSSKNRYIRHHPALDNFLFRGLVSLVELLRPSPPVDLHLNGAPLILVGTHHKTGTVLAKKLFATMCLRMRQCCSIHITSDSEHSVVKSAALKEVRLAMHLQWGWLPQSIAPPSRPYRFIHFYRDPFSKLISGYNYHRAGSEPWTERFIFHHESWCQPSSSAKALCVKSHPCKSCCHSLYWQRRHDWERGRQFLCGELRETGHTSMSLKSMLDSTSVEQGLRLEAGIEYFESFVMALLVNRTWSDPNTLNLDLDSIMKDFDSTLNQILDFIRPSSSSRAWKTLVDTHRSWVISKAEVFDLGQKSRASSSVYDWIYSSKLYHHTTSSEDRAVTRLAVESMLCAGDRLAIAFQPLVHLLGGTGWDPSPAVCAGGSNATLHLNALLAPARGAEGDGTFDGGAGLESRGDSRKHRFRGSWDHGADGWSGQLPRRSRAGKRKRPLGPGSALS